MKKVLNLLGALMLATLLFVSCKNEPDHFYPTTTIQSINLKASAYPGVNVLTWKALKDAATYTVYRSTGAGDREELVMSAAARTYFYDTAIDEDTAYKYRIIATPADLTVHDASEREVTLRSLRWAPADSSFLELAEYEANYNSNDKVLSPSTITAKLLANTGSKVRVKFPVKPYAKYLVALGQPGATALNTVDALEDIQYVYGYNCNGEAVLDLTAVYSGEKEVSVTAIPLNSIYSSDTLVSSSAVKVIDYDDISSATYNGFEAKWTNINYKNEASLRLAFIPALYNEKYFAASEYTIYRSVIGKAGETLTNGKYVYNSIEELGHPQVDKTVPMYDYPEYYYDDNITLDEDSDISGIRYYVVLNHKGKIKTANALLEVPDSSDGNWNYWPSSSLISNNASIKDIYIDLQGKINADLAGSYDSTLKLTYGSFNSYNEASMAVESELPKEITLSQYDTSNYYYSGISTESVSTYKYYAFRLVSIKEGTETLVKTMIAEPNKIGDAYYLTVKSGNPANYLASVNVSNVDTTKTTNDAGTKYESVSLSYATTGAKFYNVYRAISSSSSQPIYSDYELLTTTINTTYTDSSTVLTNTSLNSDVYYRIDAVGYYAYDYEVVKISGLAAPVVTPIDNTLYWAAVNGATRYNIYRAASEQALAAQSESDYYSYTTSASYTVPADYSNDWYYAVAAYDGNTYEYSARSAAIKMSKAAIPAASNLDYVDIFDGSSYSAKLVWDAAPAYTNYYYIYRFASEYTKAEALAYVQNNVSSYSYSTYETEYAVTGGYYYVIATRLYDSNSGGYNYNVSDVIEVESSSDFSSAPALTVNVSSFTANLSWNTIDEAVSYAICYVAQDAESLVIDDSFADHSVDSTTSTSFSVDLDTAYVYHFFVVIGLDDEDEPVGYTKFYRYNYY